MSENFEYFTNAYMDFMKDFELFQRQSHKNQKKIIHANVYLKDFLNFDLIKSYSDLIQFNKKIWSKLVYLTFEKVDFGRISSFFDENFQKINDMKIEQLKKKLSKMEIENDLLKLELEKILLGFGDKNIDKVKIILSNSKLKNNNLIVGNCQNNSFDAVNNSFTTEKNSVRKRNNSKSIFLPVNKKKEKVKEKNKEIPKEKEKNQTEIKPDSHSQMESLKISKISSDKNLSLIGENPNLNASIIDKNCFSPLSIINDINEKVAKKINPSTNNYTESFMQDICRKYHIDSNNNGEGGNSNLYNPVVYDKLVEKPTTQTNNNYGGNNYSYYPTRSYYNNIYNNNYNNNKIEENNNQNLNHYSIWKSTETNDDNKKVLSNSVGIYNTNNLDLNSNNYTPAISNPNYQSLYNSINQNPKEELNIQETEFHKGNFENDKNNPSTTENYSTSTNLNYQSPNAFNYLNPNNTNENKYNNNYFYGTDKNLYNYPYNNSHNTNIGNTNPGNVDLNSNVYGTSFTNGKNDQGKISNYVVYSTNSSNNNNSNISNIHNPGSQTKDQNIALINQNLNEIPYKSEKTKNEFLKNLNEKNLQNFNLTNEKNDREYQSNQNYTNFNTFNNNDFSNNRQENNQENDLKKSKSQEKLNLNQKEDKKENLLVEIDKNSDLDTKKMTFDNISITDESFNKRNITPKYKNNLTPDSKLRKKNSDGTLSPNNSLTVSIGNNKKPRNTKSIVKKEINRTSKVVEDFSSTKFLNDNLIDRISRERTKNMKKTPDKKKDNSILNTDGNQSNYPINPSLVFDNNFLNNKINQRSYFNNKTVTNASVKLNEKKSLNKENPNKQKSINGKNIAMMRQKANDLNILQYNSNNIVNKNKYIPNLNILNNPSHPNLQNLKDSKTNKKKESKTKSKAKSKSKKNTIENQPQQIPPNNKIISNNLTKEIKQSNSNLTLHDNNYFSMSNNNNFNQNNFLLNNSQNMSNISNMTSSYCYDNASVTKNNNLSNNYNSIPNTYNFGNYPNNNYNNVEKNLNSNFNPQLMTNNAGNNNPNLSQYREIYEKNNNFLK